MLPCTSRSGPALDLDHPALAHGRDQGFLDHGKLLAVRSFDLHAVLDAQHALLDLAQLIAVGILEDQGLAHTQRLAVHLEHLLAMVVLDPEIIADGDHLLAHLVAVAAAARSPELAIIASLFVVVPSHTPYDSWRLTDSWII